jgi:hypothetical protein
MIKDIKKLAQTLKLNKKIADNQNVFTDFPLRAPKSFVKRIKLKDFA